MNFDPAITNAQRTEFMQRLGGSDVILTDWEQRFYKDWAQAHLPDWYSAGRKKSVEDMWRKYGPMIGINFPGTSAAPPSIPPADEDGCEFFVKLDGVQQHCNAPARWINKNKFRY